MRLAFVYSMVSTCAFASYIPIGDTLLDGQIYGDTVRFRKIGGSGDRYVTVSESDFLSVSDRPFVYRWSSSYDMLFVNFAIDGEGLTDVLATGTLQSRIAECGMPIFSSSEPSGRILSMFPKESIAGGYVIGVVSGDASVVYDMTANISTYRNSGSYTKWDIKEYNTTSGAVSRSSYLVLDDRGSEKVIDDVSTGKEYVIRKQQEDMESKKTIQDYRKSHYREVVSFTNSNYSAYVDPYVKNLKSTVEFEYPKYATEGDFLTYRLTRGGVLSYPLTVHLVTNGYWCANVTWDTGESGTKTFRISTGIDERMDDNAPFEAVVKVPGWRAMSK